MKPRIPVQNCCGCTACYNACLKSAIQMKADAEGFMFPTVDEQLCVECGMCERVCPMHHAPMLHEKYEASLVAQHSLAEVLEESTSGGFIDALCHFVLTKMNGYAVGAAFDADFMPIHIVTDSYEEAKRFRNSKYAQSKLGSTFRTIKALLEAGNVVMFIGTPCQAAGLNTFLQKRYEKLYTVDLVCRSIPSPKLWREYLQWQKSRYRSEIRRVSCRKKTYGYHSGALEIEFVNGEKYAGSNRVDYFMKSFHGDVCSRRSCYDCKFKTEHRCTDFTVFDSWNPQVVTGMELVDNDRGYSNVLVHSVKGRELLCHLEQITVVNADADKMFEFTGGMERKSIRKPDEREYFYQDLDRNGFWETVEKYAPVTAADRMIESVKPLWHFIKRKLKR